MVQIAGTYQLIKNEKFVEYLVAHGIPEEKAKAGDALKPKLTVTIDGKKVTLKSDSGVNNSSSTLILDEEVDEPMPTMILKSTAKLVGDTLTVSSRTPTNQTGARIYKFSDTELVITMTSDNPKIPAAKRFYKRV